MPAMLHTNSRSIAGFTIVELAVVMTIIPIVLGVFIVAIIASVNSVSRSKIQFELDSNLQIAIDIIERDIRLSKSFEPTVTSPFDDAYGANGNGTDDDEAWSHAGVPASADSRVLLLKLPATTQSPLSNARSPVFIDSGEFNCGAEVTYNPELSYMVVYFVQDSALYRRILTDTTTPICNDVAQNQKQSCPASAFPSDSTCEARDEKIIDEISQFSVNYYRALRPNPINDVYTSTEPDILADADDVEITLEASRLFTGSPTSSSVTLRTGKIN